MAATHYEVSFATFFEPYGGVERQVWSAAIQTPGTTDPWVEVDRNFPAASRRAPENKPSVHAASSYQDYVVRGVLRAAKIDVV